MVIPIVVGALGTVPPKKKTGKENGGEKLKTRDIIETNQVPNTVKIGSNTEKSTEELIRLAVIQMKSAQGVKW